MGRAPCCDKDGMKKGPWTPEEDQKLVDYVEKNGHGRWRTLPKNAGLSRCGKSCRLRWTNYLRPDIKRGKFSSEEEETIIQLHSVLGNKWSAIASQLPGRTDNEVKNFWNTHVRKKLLRMGIDPVTHSPRLDFSSLQLNPSLCTNPSQLLADGEPFVNAELLRIVTRLLSSRQQISTLQQEQQPFLSNPGFQDQLLPQYSFPHQELRSTPIQPVADGLQLTPAANMGGQFHPGDDVPCSTLDSLSAAPQNSNLFAAVAHAMGFDPTSGEAYSFPSVMSTPASSPTPLNSSSTYINSITTTTEEERDSYCSSVLNFQDHLLDVSAYNM